MRATFAPRRTETLKPRAVPHIGQTYDWMPLWVVDEEDGGPYIGQTVWLASEVEPFFGWVPDEDLQRVAP